MKRLIFFGLVCVSAHAVANATHEAKITETFSPSSFCLAVSSETTTGVSCKSATGGRI